MPAALARFPALARLDITGDARDIDWEQPQAAALLPLLHTFRLECTSDPPPAFYFGRYDIHESLPDAAASALAAASRLQRLELQVQCWSDNILELCLALPALRDLRCGREVWRAGLRAHTTPTVGSLPPSTDWWSSVEPPAAALSCTLILTLIPILIMRRISLKRLWRRACRLPWRRCTASHM